jgi:hypothetical protein
MAVGETGFPRPRRAITPSGDTPDAEKPIEDRVGELVVLWSRASSSKELPKLLEKTTHLLQDPHFHNQELSLDQVKLIHGVMQDRLAPGKENCLSSDPGDIEHPVLTSICMFEKELKKQPLFHEMVWKFDDPQILERFGDKHFEQALSTHVNKDFFFNRAFKCYEKAARIYDEKGELDKAFALRIKMAQAPIDPSSPLYDVKSQFDREAALYHPDIGPVFIGTPSPLVGDADIKYGYFKLRRSQEGHAVLELKMTHTTRQKVIGALRALSEEKYRDELVRIFKLEGHSFSSTKFPYSGRNIVTGEPSKIEGGVATKIELKGLATIYIGEKGSDKNRIKIIFEKDPSPSDVQKLLSILGLSAATTHITEDAQKSYIFNKALHFFCPRVAYIVERSVELQAMPFPNYIKALQKNYPYSVKVALDNMGAIKNKPKVDKFCHLVLDRVVSELSKLGATGFLAGVGHNTSPEVAAKIAKGVLHLGFISGLARLDGGLFVRGASTGKDYLFNSADSVFTRLLTKSSEGTPLEDVPLSGRFQFVIDLEAAASMPYCYQHDLFGKRPDPEDSGAKSYIARPNLLELADKMKSDWNSSNEVMFKDYLPPNLIQKILYQDFRPIILKAMETHVELKDFFPTELQGVEAKCAYISEHEDEVILRLIKAEVVVLTIHSLKHLLLDEVSLHTYFSTKEKISELIPLIEKELPDYFPPDLTLKEEKVNFLNQHENAMRLILLFVQNDLIQAKPEIKDRVFFQGKTLSSYLVDSKKLLLDELGDFKLGETPVEELLEKRDVL